MTTAPTACAACTGATMNTILDTLAAIPNDGNISVLGDGVTATRRDDKTVTVIVACEYEDGDPNNGYAAGCPAATLADEIPFSRIADSGCDADGFEWWIVRA